MLLPLDDAIRASNATQHRTTFPVQKMTLIGDSDIVWITIRKVIIAFNLFKAIKTYYSMELVLPSRLSTNTNTGHLNV